MRMFTRYSLLVLLLLPAILVLPARATPPQPSYGGALVDGIPSEWNLTDDFFSLMYRAGNPSKPVESRAYLRYNCTLGIMYVLVLTEPGVVGYIDPLVQTAWVAINSQNNKVVTENSGNDMIPPDFAWVDRGFDGNPQHVHGYEASFLISPGSYNIIFHIDIFDGASQTSASPGFPGTGPPLVIDCPITGARAGTWGALKILYR